MLVVEVTLLTGRYVATVYNDRGSAEWPPHPSRLFSALVAAHCEAELSDEVARAAERAALEWLQRQPPPKIVAAPASHRAVFSVFVPVNDTSVLSNWAGDEQKVRDAEDQLAELTERDAGDKALAKARKALEKAEQKLEAKLRAMVAYDGKTPDTSLKAAVALLPEQRVKQPRTFPSCRPERPVIEFVWADSDLPAAHGAALDALLARVHRLGHSSSLVACRIGDPAALEARSPEEIYVPADDGDLWLRVPGPNQLERLDAEFGRTGGNTPGRTMPTDFATYRLGEAQLVPDVPTSTFSERLIVLRAVRDVTQDGERARRPLSLSLTRTEDVTRALRGALMHHAEEPIRAVLSGHGPDGAPAASAHLAFLPLPDVLSDWASGAILGVAVAWPEGTTRDDRDYVLRALGAWQRTAREAGTPLRLVMGRAGALALEVLRAGDGESRASLQPSTSTRPARRWATVTAIALDRNPGDLRSRDPEKVSAAVAEAERTIARSCRGIGLPEPEWVQVHRRSLFDAAPQAFDFMPYPRRSKGPRRVCVHAELHFAEPVSGPVLLGAGRYYGLGLCAPRAEPAQEAR